MTTETSIVNIAGSVASLRVGELQSDSITSRQMTLDEIVGASTLSLTAPTITLGGTSVAVEIADDSGTPQLGLFGTTPADQPTTGITAAAFVANTSTIVDDTATWGGYTAGQIVASLQQLGIIA